MQNIDYDLRSVQEARDLARLGQIAHRKDSELQRRTDRQNHTKYGARCRRKCSFSGPDGC